MTSFSSTQGDSTESTRNKNNNSKTKNSKRQKEVAGGSSFATPITTTKDGQPRSAYDKNAEWYCGEDDDDIGSIHSDGSSVLSAFRTKKETTSNNHYPSTNNGQPEVSMNFSALAMGTSSTVRNSSNDESPLSFSLNIPNSDATSNTQMVDKSFAYSMTLTASTEGQGFDVLESIPVSQLLVAENNPSDQDDNAHSKEFFDIESVKTTTERQEDVRDEIIENESFIDKLSKKKGIGIMVIGSSVFFILDVALLFLLLK
eukprot:CAMPEP_0168192866 /NCGR_PEP_ID=MMETSP0139_2-20121125/18279_1 /TAXON_ID=44445 /ORGANISM="Pseudo-nitzschia australis, Strain 10249 10 AB" /LENGTH=257 /DNA_ID=CAMNT_0008116139 /DNA_START=261 /DNA_END=1034 /DNA_ORIENTATION=-